MPYNKSKAKGSRVEYGVRDFFRSLGYEAHRVPASGAAQGFPGDILVRTPTKNLLVEVKARKSEFKKVYELLDDYKSLAVACFGELVAASYDFNEVKNTTNYTINESDKRFHKLIKLKKYLGKSDILVIKGDRKPLLFVKFE